MKTLSTFCKSKAGLVTAFMMIAVALVSLHTVLPSWSATANPSTGSAGYYVQHLHFDTQLTSTVANKAMWKIPWASRLVNIKCAGRAFGGTDTPTYTWTLQAGSTTVATCAPTTASTEVEGTLSNPSVADEASMTLDYASAGTSPTADDMDVVLVWKRQ